MVISVSFFNKIYRVVDQFRSRRWKTVVDVIAFCVNVFVTPKKEARFLQCLTLVTINLGAALKNEM